MVLEWAKLEVWVLTHLWFRKSWKIEFYNVHFGGIKKCREFSHD